MTQAYYDIFFKSFLLGQMAAHRGGMDRPPKDRLDGISHPGGKVEMADNGLTGKIIKHPMRYKAAIEFAENRVTLSPADFAKISDELKAKAWTVSRLTQLDAVERVKQYYIKSLKTEINEKAFVEAVLDDIDVVTSSKGLSRPYLSVVYRTNTMSDFNAGKLYEWSQDPPMALEFLGIDDERQTSICSVRSGTIKSYTNPWWDTNTPPLHFWCRSTLRAIYHDEYYEVTEDNSAAFDQLKKQPDIEPLSNGFGHKPFVADNHFWKHTPKQQMRVAKYLIQDELNGVVGKTLCRDFKKNIPGIVNVKTTKGGVRYAEDIITDDEFQENLRAAKRLADEYGYFVELKKKSGIKRNMEFDVWINGVEKWEFKSLKALSSRSTTKDITKGLEQARNYYINIRRGGDIEKVATPFSRHYSQINGTIIIDYNGACRRVTSDMWKTQEELFSLLTKSL